MTWQVPGAPRSMAWAVPCGCGRLNGWCAGWPGGSWSAAARWKGLAWTAAQWPVPELQSYSSPKNRQTLIIQYIYHHSVYLQLPPLNTLLTASLHLPFREYFTCLQKKSPFEIYGLLPCCFCKRGHSRSTKSPPALNANANCHSKLVSNAFG